MPTDPSSDRPDRPPRIALVAGEASGDQLGGALITALRRYFPNAEYFGVGGDRMRAAGFDTWHDRRALSVMGLAEVARHLPRLLRLRAELLDRLRADPPDILIGIDAPDFNLGLERRARETGITTVQYVSPTVWAWRSGRVRTIARAADLVLCLFPFEPDFYVSHGVAARYTGHPMADAIPLANDRADACRALGLEPQARRVALLPGSRSSEVDRLSAPFLDAAGLLAQRHPDLAFAAAVADEGTGARFRAAVADAGGPAVDIVEGRALDVMAASDVVLCASGTVTLECMLVNRPMVVAYRLAPLTYRMLKHFRMLKTDHVSLPNILAGEPLVPELIQADVTAETLADAVEEWLGSPSKRDALRARFDALHRELRCDAAASAAVAVRDLLAERMND